MDPPRLRYAGSPSRWATLTCRGSSPWRAACDERLAGHRWATVPDRGRALPRALGNCYLIQFDRLELDPPQPPAELYTLEELSGSCENCGQKRANLFKSRADM